ncbi:hypothetical protein AB1046_00445 [Promicromonospora sp. Populi]|uniref:hypothetical protein n=1 Tax=Promicromonospora sp. Populi TaxID=3239420 RepID=UPI0034E2E8BD
MRKKEDALARARRALSQVDAELDLGRARAEAEVRAGRTTRSDAPPDMDEASASGVEILRHGQRPALPRRRAAVWALTATIVLLGGAGVGTALLWPEPGTTVPGSQFPTPEPGLPTSTPGTGSTLDPSDCLSPPPPSTPRATPEPSEQPSDGALAPDSCVAQPGPSPSTPPISSTRGAGR